MRGRQPAAPLSVKDRLTSDSLAACPCLCLCPWHIKLKPRAENGRVGGATDR
jgi:hypothetical protein